MAVLQIGENETPPAPNGGRSHHPPPEGYLEADLPPPHHDIDNEFGVANSVARIQKLLDDERLRVARHARTAQQYFDRAVKDVLRAYPTEDIVPLVMPKVVVRSSKRIAIGWNERTGRRERVKKGAGMFRWREIPVMPQNELLEYLYQQVDRRFHQIVHDVEVELGRARRVLEVIRHTTFALNGRRHLVADEDARGQLR